MAKFKNREEAGTQLADRLLKFQGESPILLAVPRGGIPVAIPVAETLKVPIEIVPIRRLSVPWSEENVFGYVTHKGDLHLNHALVGQLRVSRPEIYQISNKGRFLLLKEMESWGVGPPSDLAQRTVIIVDDGVHSGWTMESAIETTRSLGAKRIIGALPVSHWRARRFVGNHCDEVVSLLTEDIALFQIANYYDDFPEISDERIRELLVRFSHAPV
jgi:putative phosphoribosyl transferase